jgi:hypothetical protein
MALLNGSLARLPHPLVHDCNQQDEHDNFSVIDTLDDPVITDANSVAVQLFQPTCDSPEAGEGNRSIPF